MDKSNDPNKDSPYHYPSANGHRRGGPTRWICYTFLGIFVVATTLHLIQALVKKRFYMIYTMCIGGFVETIGWSARLWSSFNPMKSTAFTIQITATIMAPTAVAASNFIILGYIIKIVGPQYSRLSPRNYAILFLIADNVALVVQGVGGGIAASAATQQGADRGGRIMLGGIVVQLITIIIYCIMAGNFVFNAFNNRAVSRHLVPQADYEGGHERDMDLYSEKGSKFTKEIKIMLAVLCISAVLLVIRSVYRTIELGNGWAGKIISTERWFNIFDASMVALAIALLNIFHPGRLMNENV